MVLFVSLLALRLISVNSIGNKELHQHIPLSFLIPLMLCMIVVIYIVCRYVCVYICVKFYMYDTILL